MKTWQKFILLIIVSAVVHELGHIIVGGGVTRFEYAPQLDILTTLIYVNHWNVYTAVAGFLFTLPLLLISPYPKLLFLIFLFQARWDFLYIYVNLADINFMSGWSVS